MAYKTAPSTIILSGDPQYMELPLEPLDAYGVGGITPGFLVERNASNKYQPHSSAAGIASPIFAVENMLLGKGIDDAYIVDNEAVLAQFCKPGDHVYALLEAGGGNVTAVGTLLNSNGAGLLQVGATLPVARALEVVDNDPGTDGAAMRVRVEVI